jgi:hypothetical protein
VYQQPASGPAALVRCPHCGAPHANAGFDELIFFTCNHCGNFVEVKAPKVN